MHELSAATRRKRARSEDLALNVRFIAAETIPSGERCERCRRQNERAERVAAVDSRRRLFKAEENVGHRNRDKIKEPGPKTWLSMLGLLPS